MTHMDVGKAASRRERLLSGDDLYAPNRQQTGSCTNQSMCESDLWA